MTVSVIWNPDAGGGIVELRATGPAGAVTWQPVPGLTLLLDRAVPLVLRATLLCDLDGVFPAGALGLIRLCFGASAAEGLDQGRTETVAYAPGSEAVRSLLVRLARSSTEAWSRPLRHLDALVQAVELSGHGELDDDLAPLVRQLALHHAFAAAAVLRQLPLREELVLTVDAEAILAEITALVAALAGGDLDLGPVTRPAVEIDWDAAFADLLSRQAESEAERAGLRAGEKVLRKATELELDLTGMAVPPGLSAQASISGSRVVVTVRSRQPIPSQLRVRAVTDQRILLSDNRFRLETSMMQGVASLFVAGQIGRTVFLELSVDELSGQVPSLPEDRRRRVAEARGLAAVRRGVDAALSDVVEAWVDIAMMWRSCADAWAFEPDATGRRGLALSFAVEAYRKADDRKGLANVQRELQALDPGWSAAWENSGGSMPGGVAQPRDVHAALPSLRLVPAVHAWAVRALRRLQSGDVLQLRQRDVEQIAALGRADDAALGKVRAQLRLALGERARDDGDERLLAAVLAHVLQDYAYLGPDERYRLAVLGGTAPADS